MQSCQNVAKRLGYRPKRILGRFESRFYLFWHDLHFEGNPRCVWGDDANVIVLIDDSVALGEFPLKQAVVEITAVAGGIFLARGDLLSQPAWNCWERQELAVHVVHSGTRSSPMILEYDCRGQTHISL